MIRRSIRRSKLTVAVATTAVLGSLAVGVPVVAHADGAPQIGRVSPRPSDQTISIVDGHTLAVGQIGSKIVVGGDFTKVGPGQRGAAGVVGLGSGQFGTGFPDVVGSVNAVVPDGSGGWIIGGSFTSVGSQARSNLAAVDAAGAVTAWAPNTNGVVRSLAVDAGAVYVGGGFTTVGGAPAVGAAKLDRTTGAILWDAQATGGAVQTIALSTDGATLYVGGAFTSLAGSNAQARIGAIVTASGLRSTNFLPGSANQPVSALAVDGTSLWIGGDFTKLGGITRTRLAKVDGTTGALDPLSLAVNGHINTLVVDPSASTMYVAGPFSTVGALARVNLAAVNTGTGAVGALTLPTISGTVASIALDSTGVIDIAGSFSLLPERTAPKVIAKVTVATSAVAALIPYQATPKSLARTPVGGTSGALALAHVGSSLFVGGDFSDYGLVTRNHLLAYDLATGALDLAWNPAPDGDTIYAVRGSVDGTSVYVGGAYTTIGAVSRRNLAKLSIADGTVDPTFDPSPDSYVKDLEVTSSAVYVTGNFDNINGAPMKKLAAVDPSTGATMNDFNLPLTDPTNDASEGGGRALALSPDQTKLMVIGNFATIGGADRPLIAQIDISQHPAAVTSWRTEVYNQPCARGRKGWMRDVDISPDGTTAYVVSSGHIYYPACDTANSFPMNGTGPDVKPNWSTKIGDTIEAVAATGTGVYIGGHFRYIETETATQKHFQLAVLDPATGSSLNWEPNAGGFLGVKVIKSLPSGIYVGSDGDTMGGVAHGRFGFFPAPAPGIEIRKQTATPWVLSPGQPVTFSVRVMNTYSDRSVTLNTLSDQRLGDLNGQGTCSVPQTIAASSSYTCSVTDQVNGAALADVTSTATATANNGVGIITASDTSDVQVLTSAPTYRLRLASGPWTVTYPTGNVQYGASFLNIDIRNPITVNTLTSPQYGDLSSQCGLPVTIQPNKLVYCHLTLPVSGDVGSKPSFSFSSQASTAIGNVTSNGSASITILPPPSGVPALMVVHDTTLLTASETSLRTRLAKSYNITTIDDNSITPATLANQALVIVGGSVVEAKVGQLKAVDTPMLVLRNRVLDELGMSTVAGQNLGPVTTATIAKPVHPLAADLSGTVTVNGNAKTAYWATPGANAASIQETAPGQSTEFAYQPGAVMADGSTAPDCRVYFSGALSTSFTAQQYTLFDRAAAYTSSGCGKNMLWTAVGSGSSTYSGDGQQGTAIGMNQNWGLAISAAGEVYFTDTNLHSIRKMSSTGVVTTVAGTGVAGSTGDGGPATAARLNAPARIAFDAAGNLFVADSGNNKIRKISTSGVITTVVGSGVAGFSGDGGPATAARLKTPYDVFPAPDGSLYIADRANQRIRKVSPAGIISTVAGNGTSGYNGDAIAATSARLFNPYSVALDAAGNLYIADYDNERVRVVTSDGTINTFAGIGIATANGDGGPANQAGLHKPNYLEFLPNGDLLISEVNNDRVRLVSDGLISTLAGTGQFGYLGDGGPATFSTWQRPAATALDAAGNLWIADRNNHRIRVINAG